MNTYAVEGNYQQLRNYFFEFRRLVAQKKISVQNLHQDDIDFIKNNIRANNNWSLSDSYRLYDILTKYNRQMMEHGIEYTIEPPRDQVPKHVHENAAPRRKEFKEYVSFTEGFFFIRFKYNIQAVNEIKQIRINERGAYDSANKTWKVHFDKAKELKAFAEKWQVPIGDNALRVMVEGKKNIEQSYSAERVELNLPLKMELYDYQTVGVDYCSRMWRSWLTDQMGLGKTPQAIATAVNLKSFPVIVACPKSLRQNWVNEIHAWTNYKAMIATKKSMQMISRFIEFNMCHFLIVNYDGIETFFVEEIKKSSDNKTLIKLNGIEKLFHGMIIDEAHEYKNTKTKRYKVMKKVIAHMKYRQFLTGTPFVNSIRDIAAQLQLLGVIDQFGGERKFIKQFIGVSKTQFNNIAKDGAPRGLSELNDRLRTACMIRREKHQVLKQLPDKVRKVISLDIDNRAEYDRAYMNLEQYLISKQVSRERIEKSMQAEILVRMQLLKQISAIGKVRQFVEFAETIRSQEQKLIIFCWHIDTIDELKKYWPHLMEVSGRTSDDQLNDYKARFQDHNNRKDDIIVLTYKRGGVGHTLTEASYVLFLELGWNPKDQDQAEDRAHRIGQKDNVNCLYFLGKSTMDEWGYDLINDKRIIGSQSLGSTEEIHTENIQGELMEKLIDDLTNEKDDKQAPEQEHEFYREPEPKRMQPTQHHFNFEEL